MFGVNLLPTCHRRRAPVECMVGSRTFWSARSGPHDQAHTFWPAEWVRPSASLTEPARKTSFAGSPCRRSVMAIGISGGQQRLST